MVVLGPVLIGAGGGGAVMLVGMTAAEVAGQEGGAAAVSGGAGDVIDLSTAAGLARSLADMLHASHQVLMSEVSPVAAKVGAHLGCALSAMASVGESFPLWEHANLQRGVDAYLASRPGDAEWFGVGSMGRGHEDLATMITAPGPGTQVVAVAHGTVAVGPDAVMEVVQSGVALSETPDGSPVVIGIQVTDQYGSAECRVDVLAARQDTAVAVRDEIGRLMRARDVFRGQVLSFGVSEHRGNDLLTFLPRPDLTAAQVILPAGVLDSIERHVIGVTSYAERLRAAGQHLKRGLLLHGLPGTGKTHTVRYLMSRMRDCTVIVLTGHAMQFLERPLLWRGGCSPPC